MHHLSERELVGLAYRTRDAASAAQSAAHLAWCASCRSRAEALYAALEPLQHWQAPPFREALQREAIAAAVARRDEQRLTPRALRWSGIRPGAAWRPARLGVLSLFALSVLMVLAGGAWFLFNDGRRIESELSLFAPPILPAGGQVAVAVQASSSFGPTAGVPVSLSLLDDDTGRTLASTQGTTGAGGVASLLLALPPGDAVERVSLIATGDVSGDAREARLVLSVRPELRAHLSADKPTYQPGQTVHLRGLVFDRGTGKPAAKRSARVEVFDPRGTKLSRTEATLSAQGVASADFELAPGAPLGSYRALLSVEGQTVERTFSVERYTLPSFTVEVSPLVASTDGVSPFEAEIKGRYTFGGELPRGEARLEVSFAGSILANLSAPLTAGVARVTVPALPEWVRSQARMSGGALRLRGTVIDPAARAEEATSSLALTRDALVVELRSEAPSLRYDLPRPNQVLVRTSRPDGSPVSAEVKIFSPDAGEEAIVGKGETVTGLSTGPDGLGRFDLPPAFVGRSLAALAKDPSDGKQYWRAFAGAPVASGPSVLSCDKALLRAGESLSCEVYNPDTTPLIVRASVAQLPVALGAAPQGITKVTFALPASRAGLLRLDWEGAPESEPVYALVSPSEGLRVEVAGDVPKKPGEEAILALRVSDDQGRPRAAAVGLALVDAAVFARVGGESPRQVIEALYRSPGLAAELSALLFPPALPGAEGGRGAWTSLQQVSARWALAGAQESASSLGQDRSRWRDENALQASKRDAEEFFSFSVGLVVVFSMLLVLGVALLRSFWFRSLLLAGPGALVVTFFSAEVFHEVFDFRRGDSEFLGLLAGAVVFVFVLGWRFMQRPKAVQAEAPRDPAWVFILAGLGSLGGLFLLFMVPVGTKYAPEFALGSSKQEESYAKAAAPAPVVAAVPSPQVAREKKPEAPEDILDGAPRDADKAGGEGDGDEGKKGAARVREEFPETLFYDPAVITGDDGRAEVRFQMADSITTWTLFALASDANGALGALEGGIEVFQELFVELEVPRDLTVGDSLSVQAAVHNYQKTPAVVQLRAEPAPGLALDPQVLAAPLTVPAGGVVGLRLPLSVLASGEQSLTLSADAGSAKDAIKRSLDVSPAGRETRQAFSGLVTDEVERRLDIPAAALVDGRRVTLTLFGSPLAQALDGLERSLETPHGCFEQVSSTTYPNALILKALRATGRATPEAEARALRLLRLGYQELLPYESPGGGFSWFGNANPDARLSAYGLLEFTEMASLIEVDPGLLERTRLAIASQQDANGGFGGPAQSAYVTWALVESDPEWASKEDPNKPWSAGQRRAREATKRAVEGLIRSFSVIEGLDTYALSLAANAFLASGPAYHDKAQAILDLIWTRAIITGDGSTRRVSFATAGGSLYGSFGSAAEVETTALVAYALISAKDKPERARETLRSLLVLRDPRTGGFYSTQGTILSLRALLAAAKASDLRGKALVLVDGNEVAAVEFTGKNADLPQVVDLSQKVTPTSVVTIAAGEWSDLASDVSYRLSVRYFTPWTSPAAPPIETIGADDPALTLQSKLSKPVFRLGDEGDLSVNLARTGGATSRGMILVEIGLPPGFRMTGNALAQLQSSGARRVEVLPRGVALYLDDPGAGARLSFSVPLVATRGVRQVQTPPSRAYFYYQPWIESVTPPLPVAVNP
jgi:hypothetical protein